jgi:hypothetical protein
LALALFAPAASAGDPIGAAPLTVVKTVSGTVPAGTTFTATIQCQGGAVFDGGGTTRSVTFDAQGQPTGPSTFTFDDGPGTCTVTETANGGATTTTYACAGENPVDEIEPPIKEGFEPSAVLTPDDPPCTAAGPQTAPIVVNIVAEDQDATITIANTFVEPTPQAAPQVVAQPAFTG